jgi:hypothetical protein
MKSSTWLLLGLAAAGGYALAKRRAKASTAITRAVASPPFVPPQADPQAVTPAVVVIDNDGYNPYDYYWGPQWWGPWSGGGGHRHGGGHHHGGGGHHGGHH